MRPHLTALTGARFLAALYVLVVHFGRHMFRGPLEDFAYMGSSGVSMFFVLSGFILTYTYEGRPMQPGRFWWARFARIWPVYVLSLALSLPIYWNRFEAYLASSGDNALHVLLRFATGTQAWTLSGEAIRMTTVINNPSWSISTEVFFYLLFPLLLPLASRSSLRTLILVAVGIWVVVTLPAWLLSYGVDLGMVTDEVVYKSPVFRVGEFLLGIAVGQVFLRRPEWARTPRLAWLSWLLAFVLLAYGMRAGLPRLVMVSGALAPVFALVVLTLAARGGPARLFEWRPLVFLGEASYAFYLAHYPVALFLSWAGLRIGTNTHFWSTFGVTLVCSVLAFVLVERPARARLRRLSPVRRELIKP